MQSLVSIFYSREFVGLTYSLAWCEWMKIRETPGQLDHAFFLIRIQAKPARGMVSRV